ncbi:MAG: class I SAM-dependent methyltransferase [Anaerolineae bacterium]|nr:class I SAM-dependent methyltransferase [Anaerolineae bacterium]
MTTPAERWARRIEGSAPPADADWDTVSRSRWDSVAEAWSARVGRDWTNGWRAGVLPFIHALLPRGEAAEGVQPPEGSETFGRLVGSAVSILDAGCGAGHLVESLAQAGYQAAGVDISPAMIQAAQTRLSQAGLAADLRVGHLAATGFPDQSFDLVACIAALEWVASPRAALTEFARLLKPDGVLVVGILSALSPIRVPSYKRFLDLQIAQNSLLPWELTALLTDLGWSVEAEAPSGWLEEYATVQAIAETQARLGQCICGIWLVAARPRRIT